MVCLYVAVEKVKMESEEFLTFLIKDIEQTFSCVRFFAAKCDWKYDRIQAQFATLSTGETTYQFHGCKIVKIPNGWRNAYDEYWHGFRGLHDAQNY